MAPVPIAMPVACLRRWRGAGWELNGRRVLERCERRDQRAAIDRREHGVDDERERACPPHEHEHKCDFGEVSRKHDHSRRNRDGEHDLPATQPRTGERQDRRCWRVARARRGGSQACRD